MAWNRNPTETDPLLVQSQRGDFPVAVERQLVDGGARGGRLETSDWPGMIALAAILSILFIGLLVFFWLRVYG